MEKSEIVPNDVINAIALCEKCKNVFESGIYAAKHVYMVAMSHPINNDFSIAEKGVFMTFVCNNPEEPQCKAHWNWHFGGENVIAGWRKPYFEMWPDVKVDEDTTLPDDLMPPNWA